MFEVSYCAGLDLVYDNGFHATVLKGSYFLYRKTSPDRTEYFLFFFNINAFTKVWQLLIYLSLGFYDPAEKAKNLARRNSSLSLEPLFFFLIWCLFFFFFFSCHVDPQLRDGKRLLIIIGPIDIDNEARARLVQRRLEIWNCRPCIFFDRDFIYRIKIRTPLGSARIKPEPKGLRSHLSLTIKLKHGLYSFFSFSPFFFFSFFLSFILIKKIISPLSSREFPLTRLLQEMVSISRKKVVSTLQHYRPLPTYFHWRIIIFIFFVVDKVTIHYVGTLAANGEQFDSSRDRWASTFLAV